MTQGSSSGTYCMEGAKALGQPSAQAWGEQKEKKSPLWQTIQHTPLVQTFTKLWTPAEQNNLMSLLFSFHYCLLRTKCSIFSQGKHPILIRSFFPQTFKLCPVPQNEYKTLYKLLPSITVWLNANSQKISGDIPQWHKEWLRQRINKQKHTH